jgi:hypothetical protein
MGLMGGGGTAAAAAGDARRGRVSGWELGGNDRPFRSLVICGDAPVEELVTGS